MSNKGIQVEEGQAVTTAIVEMFVLDASSIVPVGVNGIFRFHSGTTIAGQDIVWQGNTYTQMPVEAEGFEFNARGTQPRPRIRFSNVNGYFTGLVLLYQDLVGAKIIRKRTFYKRLDAVNYPGGVNPNADPTSLIPDDIFYINQKTAENKNVVEFELTSSLDMQDKVVPGDLITSHICRFHYRDSSCGEAEDYCFAQQDDSFIPAKSFGLFYRGRYSAALTYKRGTVTWIPGTGLALKKFYYATSTPVKGENIATSSHWVLDQVYRGVYNPIITYIAKDTVYRVIDTRTSRREYYYNPSGSLGIEPPSSPWIADRCSLNVNGCKLRFSEDVRGLPFGGFPGTNISPVA